MTLEQNKTILLGMPIHNREWILPIFLEKVSQIDYPKELITIYFLVNNSVDDSFNIVKKFKDENKSLYKEIIIEEVNNVNKIIDTRENDLRMKHTFEWLSHLRNIILRKTVKLNCDYLFSLDSDILVEPDILNNLLSSEKNICSSIIYNGFELHQDRPFAFPNILNNINGEWKHIVNYRTKFPYKNEPNKIIEVGMTGAVSIISKEVCKVAKYEKHFIGEDCAFSESALKYGYKSYCNISQLSHHIMNKEGLDKWLNGELYFWFDIDKK